MHKSRIYAVANRNSSTIRADSHWKVKDLWMAEKIGRKKPWGFAD